MGGIANRAGSIVTEWRYELVIFTTAAVLAAAGLFAGFQQTIYDALFRVVTRPPSGEIVLVQIDPRSLSAVATWPWPRSRHAEAITRLKAAGAEIIALDIDFSSPSRAEEDAALAAALADAEGHVVLPSFIQHAVRGVTQELTETEPLPALRKHALVGNANVFAPQGKARAGAFGLILDDGKYRPTFAALLGQKQASTIFDFEIDFGIDTSKVHRISMIDVLNGSFDPNIVKGKRVVVGATAIELGDLVPVPVRGIIPGVELQLLIAESIIQGRTLMPTGPIGGLLIVVLTLIVLRPSHSSWSIRGHGAPLVATMSVLTAGPALALFLAPVLVETAPALFAAGACFFCTGLRELSSRARAVLRERSTGNFRRVLVNLIVEESSDGVVVADHAGRIELCNERAAVLLSATPATLMSRRVGRFLPVFDALPATGDSAGTLRQTEHKAECDGGTVFLDVSVRRMTVPPPTTGGDPIRVDVYTLRDVTARRRTEEAERRAQADRLMAERAKSNFIANMSHELRTPLNAIIGFSEMMASQLMGPLGQPQYVEFSQVVAKSGHHLLSLVNNILEISRIDNEAESLVVEEVDFDACAEASAAFARSSRDYKAQAITVEVAEGAKRVRADRRVIKQTLANLLSNAVKFTGPAGKIHVRAWVEGESFMFEVSDNGVGIEPTLMPHLTDLFRHADQSFARKHEGMGAGLHLVKRYLDLMNGTLSFESTLGKGTRVCVTLPGAAVATPFVEASEAAA